MQGHPSGWDKEKTERLLSPILGRRLIDGCFDGYHLVLVFEEHDKRTLHLAIAVYNPQITAELVSWSKYTEDHQVIEEPEAISIWDEVLSSLEGEDTPSA